MALLLKKVERPRDLKWYQAGAMLYGDWGTSKAYVLGIAFALAGHASWFFLGLMSLLTVLVGVCYMVICRIYPDGGGVYSSVRPRSENLAVVGALLLVADYVVTASLSALEAFHYFNFPNPHLWAVFSIVLIAALNWVGPAKGGSVAAVIAVLASAAAGILFLSTLPHLPHVELTWPERDWSKNWSVFVGIVLALSGVEAVANMTGIMKQPVQKTSRRAILPVLLEVSFLTFLLGVAMNAIPGLTGHTEDMLRALGNYYIGPWYGQVIAVIFGFLLLSAVNTSISSLVSIQFLMARDRELPAGFAKLNRYGMPFIPLFVAAAVPSVVLLFERDVVGLAALYAIGVVGAITLNLGMCATNFKIALKKWERVLLISASALLLFIEVTIAIEKRGALLFVLCIIGTGLALRAVAKKWVALPALQVVPDINVLTVSEACEIAPLYTSSTLVSIRAVNKNLLEEAALRVKALGENTLYLNYVEEVPSDSELPQELEPSQESLDILGQAQKILETLGITAVPIWQMGYDPGRMIVRAARELKVGAVFIGATRRSALTKILRGDVLRTLAHQLPKECHLVISS
ncbi:MAG: amino acid permease [Candidatus Omnitrophica bacterium]|nr:amino acid permease [Candidatus Omnitrophota bacterium]